MPCWFSCNKNIVKKKHLFTENKKQKTKNKKTETEEAKENDIIMLIFSLPQLLPKLMFFLFSFWARQLKNNDTGISFSVYFHQSAFFVFQARRISVRSQKFLQSLTIKKHPSPTAIFWVKKRQDESFRLIGTK
jgi:hypothetical protein